MEPETRAREPITGLQLLARGFLWGSLPAFVLWFAWWQLLGQVWTDCDAGSPIGELAIIIILSPLVILSASLAFAMPAGILGRRRPRTAFILGLVLAVFVTYLWFAVAVPLAGPDSLSFRTNTCQGGAPPWWPSWLPF